MSSSSRIQARRRRSSAESVQRGDDTRAFDAASSSVDRSGDDLDPGTQEPAWYDQPSWYDIVNQRGSAKEARDLDTLARRYARTPFYRADHTGAASPPDAPIWLEPACGSGRLLRAGAMLGARVIGVDSNPNMVRYARESLDRRGLPGTVIEAPMQSFRLNAPADLAFCPHNSIRHLPTDQEMTDHLNAIARSLKQGGIYAVGLGTSIYGSEFPTEDVWTGRRGSLRVTQVVQYLPADASDRRERVLSVLHLESPRSSRCVEMAYDLRTYSRTEWLDIIEKSDLRLLAETDERGEPAPPTDGPGYRVWVLVRIEDAGERAPARRSS